MSRERKIRVLIVDDSAIVRKTLGEALSREADIEVVGSAPDPFVARDKILALKPDVLTLDIEMPRMDGLTFLRKLMQHHPMPAIVISSLGSQSCETALEAVRLGAVEFLPKPGGPYSVGDLRRVLAEKVRAAASARIQRNEDPPPPAPAASAPATARAGANAAAAAPAPAAAPVAAVLPVSPASPPAAHPVAATPAPAATKPCVPVPARPGKSPLICIGASTGGTEAIYNVLRSLPAQCPPVLIVQHIPPVFSRAFAERLNRVCPMSVREAADGDLLEWGLALVAPGDFHMVLARDAARYRVLLKQGPRVCYQRPAVDVLFVSVAEAAKDLIIAALLTGMGSDGARGMLKLRQGGAVTLAQDEASCVVYGMPREAVQIGAAQKVVPLHRMAAEIMSAVEAWRPAAKQA